MRSGWKGSKASGFFAGADELDRLAGDVTDGDRCAATRVAVHLGEDDAGEAEALMKILSRVDGVLACHGIGDEENLRGREKLLELLHLGHQLFVDMKAAGSVHDKRVAGENARFAASLGGEALHELRSGRFVVDFAFVEAGLDGLGDDFELLARGRTVDVDGDEHGAVAAFF